MILGPFLNNRPLVVLLLIPIIVSYQLLNLQYPFHIPAHSMNFGLWGKIDSWSTLVDVSVSSIIIFLNAIQLNYLFNKHEFLPKYNYSPSLFYVVLISFSHAFYQPDAILLVHVLLIQVLRLVFNISSGDGQFHLHFNIAFFVGLCGTLIPMSAGLILPIWLAIWFYHPFSFRVWLISLLGFFTPIINGLVYWWYSGHKINSHLIKPNTALDYELSFYISLSAIIIILLFISFISIRLRLRKSNIRFKKLNRVMIWLLFGFLAFGVAGMLFYQQNEWIGLIFIPFCYFYAYAFLHPIWKKIASFFFYVTFIGSFLEFFIFLLDN